MEVIIESILCRWNEDVTEAFLKLLNVCLLSCGETNLRKAITELRETDPSIDKNFAFGYGAAHLWVYHKKNKIKSKQYSFL